MSQQTKLFFAAITVATLSIIAYTCQFQQKDKIHSSKKSTKVLFEQKEEDGNRKLQEIGERMQQEFEKTRNPTTRTIPQGALINAKNATEKILQSSGGDNIAVADLDWQNRGPSNVGGRTRAILFDANDATNNTVFSGGVGGGLWKSTNFQSAAPSWTPIDDFFDNIAITAIVQDQNNPSTMYFGTGEGWFNVDAIRGLGIWKSTDSGATWAQLAATNNSNFNYTQDLLIDNNGNLYASTRDRGVQRSTDGGTSFQQVVGSSVGVGATNRATDLELGPDGDIYAALGIFSTGAVFHSADNLGANTGAAGNWTAITPPGSFYRIELATAASQSGRIYAVCQGNGSNDVTNISRTDNHGASWTSVTVPTFCDQGTTNNFTRGQAWYDLIAGVDPTNANRIYVGGVDGLRSDDGGSTWTQITSWTGGFNCVGLGSGQFVHADHHAIVFEPGNSNKLVWGTDGGLFHTLDGTIAAPVFISKNKNYNVTQFYGTAIHPDIASHYFLAGAQDNGTQRFNAPGYSSTVQVTGGDGGIPHIDQDNPDIQITVFTNNNYNISTNGGESFAAGARSNTGRFINPSDYDNSANILYAAAGNNQYFRWDNPATGGNTNSTLTVNELGGQVSAVFTSPNVANRVYFGTGAGTIVRVDNANTGASGSIKVGTVLFNGPGFISSVEVQTGNENHLIATISNYGVASVFESTDGGSNWTNIEGNLPDMPVRWGIFNPTNSNEVLLATELGVWSTSNLNGVNTVWMPTNANLANVRVDMLQYRSSDDIIVAATHGRGLYVAGGAVPSCTDGVKNGTELGVDCGCNCPNNCNGNPAPAETIETAIEIVANGTINTNGATTGNGCYGCANSSHADWYSFTAPENGTLDVGSCGGNSDSRLFIHEGVCGFLNTLASSDDACNMANGDAFASQLLGVPVECGKTYYLEWDNRWDGNAFAFTFAYNMTAACEGGGNGGDQCAATLTDATINNGMGEIVSATYQAETTLSSSGDVMAASTVNFEATTSITLTAGFSVQAGATFSAKIATVNCPNNVQPALAEARGSNLAVTTEPIGVNQITVYPNPISSQATVDYELVNKTPISLAIYNSNGQLVKVLLDKVVQETGQYTMPLNVSDLPQGIYYVNLQSDSGNLIKKLMVIR